jgi:hypothetical protein
MDFKQVIENAKRALVAHCLISSLETSQDEDVDQAWVKLAEKRYEELISGKAAAVSWEDIKKEV